MQPVSRRDIADGGVLIYHARFLTEPEADELFATLKAHTPWKQEIGSFGRPFPRLTAYYADPGVSYTYSGVTHPALPWPDCLVEVRRRVEKSAGAPMNSLLLNYYRHGDDSMGFHSDDEPELGVNPVIPSLSLGATRQFVLRHKSSKERITYDLTHGSLLVMAGATQHHWQHTIPKTKKPVGERINLTFRSIRSGVEETSDGIQ
jgi:alkylated DNA repair dioxygenase AlkB